jgi:flavodoxin
MIFAVVECGGGVWWRHDFCGGGGMIFAVVECGGGLIFAVVECGGVWWSEEE